MWADGRLTLASGAFKRGMARLSGLDEYLAGIHNRQRLSPIPLPLLEYNSVVWSPQTKQDIECIEQVQRRFTKLLPGLNSLLV